MRRASPARMFAPGALAATVAVLGCGLISSDITKLSFDLPPKSYAFDTANWNLPAGANFPDVPCGDGQVVTDCCHPPAPLPAVDCAVTPLSCDAVASGGSACALHQPITVTQTVNLGQEVPVLRSLSGQRLVDITISQIRYTVVNTLNVDLPPVELFLAADGVKDTSDPSKVMKFGTVPSMAAMTDATGAVRLEDDAEQIFARYAAEFATPFTFLATTTVVVPSGSPIPNGRVDITVTGQVSAGL